MGIARPALLAILQQRCERNRGRHPGVDWTRVEARVQAQPGALATWASMEDSGGESDAVDIDANGRMPRCDCSPESLVGRRSLCRNQAALEARKHDKPHWRRRSASNCSTKCNALQGLRVIAFAASLPFGSLELPIDEALLW
ncbi:MAG: DUF4256 domain-containing protein [Xanthomonadales bacterium]|nr:hypothetical protein [Xanthomonadales bacterium]MCC6593466.1 DUF4256 domain-containing protein [Xanthomonadales bacterium]MCE7929881.1 DUF4256 family protein [Xanthomonadales bacterium PRO6]